MTANTKVATELKEIPLLTHNMQQTFLQIKNFGGERNNIFYVNFKLTSVGGRYFNPINFELSSKAGEAIFNNEKAFSVKQSAYFRADLKLGYRKYYKKSSLKFVIDLQNVSGNQNIFQQGYN